MWNILKQILPSKKCNTSSDIQPDTFNEYFSTIGEKLTKDFGEVVLPELNISTLSDFQRSTQILF